ncbi:zinc ribbon domain-containing protein [Acetohalobium arabaticum]|uniref:zinc ribbon domain-containing protein n=1 Tax=Acetohalobium arabaticum TaxID=28187 RepID=UPI000A0495C9
MSGLKKQQNKEKFYKLYINTICGKKGNRKSQGEFVCPNGHKLNADYNASVNIAQRAI